MTLNSVLYEKFKLVLDRYHQSLWRSPLSGEKDFVNRTLNSFQNLTLTGQQQVLTIRSQKPFWKPLVKYFPYGLLFPERYVTIMLGNLLLKCKHKMVGRLISHRAILVNVKFTKGEKKTWRISSNQFNFLNKWFNFQIMKPEGDQWYSLKPTTLTWSTYGFIGSNVTNYPIYYSADRVLRQNESSSPSKSFQFVLGRSIGWDSSTSFLIKLVKGLIGENLLLNNKVKMFVEDLTEAKQETLFLRDKSEMRKQFAEDQGFGVVEFILESEEIAEPQIRSNSS